MLALFHHSDSDDRISVSSRCWCFNGWRSMNNSSRKLPLLFSLVLLRGLAMWYLIWKSSCRWNVKGIFIPLGLTIICKFDVVSCAVKENIPHGDVRIRQQHAWLGLDIETAVAVKHNLTWRLQRGLRIEAQRWVVFTVIGTYKSLRDGD